VSSLPSMAHAILNILLMMALAFAANTSYSIISRARNRNNMTYHLIAACYSNAVWFATMKFLIVAQSMNWLLFVPYTIGTVSGSITGAKVSIRIEKWLHLSADEHLKEA